MRDRIAAWKTDQLARFVEGTSDRAVMLLDPVGRITACTRATEAVFGWSRDDLIGRSAKILYTAEPDPATALVQDLNAARSSSPLRVEGWRARSDGTEFCAETVLVALHDDEGEVTGFGQSTVDVTARYVAEQARRQSEIHMRSILATIPDAMIVIDERGIILSFSAAAERLFGYAEADVAGRNVKILMPAPNREQHDAYIGRYLTTGERRIIGIGRVVTGLRSDGTQFPMELQVGEARDDRHRIFTGFVRDLTAQQLAELRLRELQSELIHVSRLSAMGTLASTLAHELNQPLAATVNYLEAARDLVRGEGAEATSLVAQALHEAANEALRAGQIVRRLRDFVGRGETDRALHDLPVLIDEAARLGLPDQAERGIRLFRTFDPAAARVLADRIQIQQVLVNLFRNAAQAVVDSDRRDIIITTRRDGAMVEIIVADTGPGIAPDMNRHLFEAFASSKAEGMGLGLSICRTIIEAHGGRIWAAPEVETGAAFHFTVWSGEAEEGR